MKKVEEFEIRKGVPIPRIRHNRPLSSAISKVMREMGVGDCIDVVEEANFASTRGSLTRRGKQLGYRFTVRTILNGEGKIMRIWRVK